MYQSLWDAAKAIPRGKLKALDRYTKKMKNLYVINNVSIYHKKELKNKLN